VSVARRALGAWPAYRSRARNSASKRQVATRRLGVWGVVPQGAEMIDVTVPTYPHLSAETWIDANNLPGLIDIRSASAFLSSAYITCAAAALPASRKGSAPYFAAVWRSIPKSFATR
jgi:hypothetical protein